MALETQDKLREKGIDIIVMGIQLLSPLPFEKITHAMGQATQTLVIEQNQQGQFAHYLRSFYQQGQDSALPPFHQYCRPGPTLFTPEEIVTQIQTLIPDQTTTEGSARQ